MNVVRIWDDYFRKRPAHPSRSPTATGASRMAASQRRTSAPTGPGVKSRKFSEAMSKAQAAKVTVTVHVYGSTVGNLIANGIPYVSRIVVVAA